MSSFNLKEIVRPCILKLVPYRCARDDYSDGILLDANENAFGPALVEEWIANLNRYPDPRQEDLKRKLAKWRNVKPSEIFTGVGSDEAIDLLMRIVCRPAVDNVLICPPTYGMYSVSATINDVGIIRVPLTSEFQLQVPEIIKAITPKTKIVFVCSPNNPTANLIDRKSIISLLDQYKSGIVVVDEAYVDFASEESWCSEIKNYPNLLIMQTFSKSFGLAGARIGCAYANSELIQIMDNVKAPYNINALTSKVANDAMDSLDILDKHIKASLESKKTLIAELEKLPQVKKIFPSDANFVLVQMEKALEVYKNIADVGVVIRYRGNQQHCNDCNRITVGTPEENIALIEKLKIVYSKL